MIEEAPTTLRNIVDADLTPLLEIGKYAIVGYAIFIAITLVIVAVIFVKVFRGMR